MVTLYLHQEGLGDRPGAAEDAYRDFGITDNLLDQASERRDRALVVVAGPQIEVAVRVRFDFPAPAENPWV